MNIQYNSIKIEGNDNVVLQTTTGNAVIEDFQIFIGRFTKEKEEKIILLEKILFDKEKIEGLSQDRMDTLSNDLKNLINEKNALEVQISEMLDDFSRKDFSQAGEIYQQAFNLFANAKLDEAIEILNDIRLQEELNKIEWQEKNTLKERENLAENYLLKAQMLQLKFAFSEAEECYRSAIKICNICKYYDEAGKFYRTLNEFDNAADYFKQALKLASTPVELASVLNNSANLQFKRHELDLAEENYNKALNLFERLAESKPQFWFDVSTALNNLAIVQNRKNKVNVAEANHKRALKIRRKLAESQPSIFLPKIASSLNNLAVLQSFKKEFYEAEKNYIESLSIYKNLAIKNPQEFLSFIAGTLNNLGNVYLEKGDNELAFENHIQSLKIYRDLAVTNPRTYLPHIAESLLTISNLDIEGKISNKSSISMAKEAIDIGKQFLHKLPEAKNWIDTGNLIISYCKSSHD